MDLEMQVFYQPAYDLDLEGKEKNGGFKHAAQSILFDRKMPEKDVYDWIIPVIDNMFEDMLWDKEGNQKMKRKE